MYTLRYTAFVAAVVVLAYCVDEKTKVEDKTDDTLTSCYSACKVACARIPLVDPVVCLPRCRTGCQDPNGAVNRIGAVLKKKVDDTVAAALETVKKVTERVTMRAKEMVEKAQKMGSESVEAIMKSMKQMEKNATANVTDTMMVFMPSAEMKNGTKVVMDIVALLTGGKKMMKNDSLVL